MTVFLLVQLKSAPLDSPIPGLSPLHALLLLFMIAAIPLIPYLFLYLFLGDKSGTGEPVEQPIHKLSDWLHWHRHPELLHH